MTHLFETAGIELLNINNIASELGDNRASIYLINAVSKAAMNCGPNDFYRFFNLEHTYDPDWMRTILMELSLTWRVIYSQMRNAIFL